MPTRNQFRTALEYMQKATNHAREVQSVAKDLKEFAVHLLTHTVGKWEADPVISPRVARWAEETKSFVIYQLRETVTPRGDAPADNNAVARAIKLVDQGIEVVNAKARGKLVEAQSLLWSGRDHSGQTLAG